MKHCGQVGSMHVPIRRLRSFVRTNDEMELEFLFQSLGSLVTLRMNHIQIDNTSEDDPFKPSALTIIVTPVVVILPLLATFVWVFS